MVHESIVSNRTLCVSDMREARGVRSHVTQYSAACAKRAEYGRMSHSTVPPVFATSREWRVSNVHPSRTGGGPAGQARLGKDVRASGRSQNLRAVSSEEPKGEGATPARLPRRQPNSLLNAFF